MARRFGLPLNGAQYCANKSPSKRQIHDLDKETKICQINEIIAADHAVPYSTLPDAYAAGYDNCAHCIGGPRR